MASATAPISMALVPTRPTTRRHQPLIRFWLPAKAASTQVTNSGKKHIVNALSDSTREQTVVGLTAAALAAAMVITEAADAAQPGLSPSLKNFLLSIVSGGVVLLVLLGAVIAVANFDPVKRS